MGIWFYIKKRDIYIYIYVYIYIYCMPFGIPPTPPMTDWKEIGEMRPNIAQVGLLLGWIWLQNAPTWGLPPLREYSRNGLPGQVGDEKKREPKKRENEPYCSYSAFTFEMLHRPMVFDYRFVVEKVSLAAARQLFSENQETEHGAAALLNPWCWRPGEKVGGGVIIIWFFERTNL